MDDRATHPFHRRHVDPARPAATETTEPTPSDSAVTPDREHETAGGMGHYLEPGRPEYPVEGDGGYASAKPLLMQGAAGPDVAELGHLLADHGYPNAISKGTADAPPVLDDELMATVIAFQRDNGIDPWSREGADATNPPLLRQNVHQGIVDARTWEALLDEAPVVVREGARA
jgi:hypothetical protein